MMGFLGFGFLQEKFRIRSGSVTLEEEERKQGKEKKKKKRNMTITPAVRIAERKLVVKDRTILSGVPDNVIPTSGASSGPVEGIFLGAEFSDSSCRQVVSLGTLRYTVKQEIASQISYFMVERLF